MHSSAGRESAGGGASGAASVAGNERHAPLAAWTWPVATADLNRNALRRAAINVHQRRAPVASLESEEVSHEPQ
jgi:hypothetical protein